MSMGDEANRLAGIKSARDDKKRAEVLERKRRQSAPHVVGLLPLSSDPDCQAVWDLIIQSVNTGERKADEHAGRKEAVCREGQQALKLPSHLGVTSCIGLACGAEGGNMKARSAPKKAAEGALRSHCGSS
eukprot:jgi/Tetstr1/429210/TSEL_019162.t1